MKTTTTTTKATANKATTTKKAPAKKTTAKKVETPKAVENKKKVDMTEINKVLTDAKIKIANPDAKGNYRIFGAKKGSSLNVQKAAYIIYSTDEDYKAVKEAKIEGVELTENGNSQDKVRPNIVRMTAMDVLKKVLKVYAKNPVNVAQ